MKAEDCCDPHRVEDAVARRWDASANARLDKETGRSWRHQRGASLLPRWRAGQAGSLLPHVAVPAVMAKHLIPEWSLSASQAGFMASSFALGYMLAVPLLTALK